MMRHISWSGAHLPQGSVCIGFQCRKDPASHLKKDMGVTSGIMFSHLNNTIDGIHYPRTVWKSSYAEHVEPGKT